MKKLVLFVVLVLFAVPVFAADYTTATPPKVPTGLPDAGKVLSTLSNNVEMNVVSSHDRYSAVTAHINGSKQYATGTDSTKIYNSAYGDGTALLNITASDTSQYASWTAL
jgi:hypothetical protein